MREQSAKCFSAMTVLVFLLGGKLRKGFLESSEIENRIVAKAARSACGFQNFPVDTLRHDREGASLFRERNHTNEMRSAFASGFSTHLVQQLFDSLRIRRAGPRVPRGLYSGRSAKGRHDHPRIIGEHHLRAMP